jgi:hypothetical protein
LVFVSASSAIIFNSQAVAAHYRPFLGATPQYVVYNGVIDRPREKRVPSELPDDFLMAGQQILYPDIEAVRTLLADVRQTEDAVSFTGFNRL